jgi:hypothetical protein
MRRMITASRGVDNGDLPVEVLDALARVFAEHRGEGPPAS